MSKIETALQKLTTDQKSLVSGDKGEVSRRGAAETSAASGATGFRQEARDLRVQARKSIKINREMLFESGVLISEQDQQELRDEMRRIKWPVLANAFGEQSDSIRRGNVVMVASATSGEGKTFTTTNLAMSIAAEQDHGVILVDADIVNPKLSEAFGIVEHPGVIDFLLGEVADVADIIIGTDLPGLSLIPAGRAHEHASELLASNRMAFLVSQLNDHYPSSIVLFDTSPILQTNESQVLSRIVGQVLLVVAANKTPQHAAIEAVRMLGTDRVVNLIFNGVNALFRQRYRYGGYYGYQSRR